MKPTIENGFDYRRLAWKHLPHTHEAIPAAPEADDVEARGSGDSSIRLAQTADRTYLCRTAEAQPAMFDAAIKALTQMFSPEFRRVLFKSIGLALLMIILIGIGLNWLFDWLTNAGAAWAKPASAATRCWTVISWIIKIALALGVVTGAIFLMPAVTAFVGSFFVDEIGEIVERTYYPAEPPGRELPLMTATIQGTKTALLAILICCSRAAVSAVRGGLAS